MVMGELFLHLKRNMEYELEKTVVALILKSGDTNKFLREDCHVSLDHMVLMKYISLLDTRHTKLFIWLLFQHLMIINEHYRLSTVLVLER